MDRNRMSNVNAESSSEIVKHSSTLHLTTTNITVSSRITEEQSIALLTANPQDVFNIISSLLNNSMETVHDRKVCV